MPVSSQEIFSHWNTSKKPILGATTICEKGTKKEDVSKKTKDTKYGAWGPTFKNKNHFTNLHSC